MVEAKRGDNQLARATGGLFDWDWDPSFSSFQRRLENLEKSVIPSFSGENQLMRTPTVDMKETDNLVQIVAELPGLNKKDIKIDVDDERRMLTLKGEQSFEKKDDNERYHYRERGFGSFERSFRLPDYCNLEQVKANLNNGLLMIDIPKVAQQKTQKRRTVDIGDQTK